MRRGLLALAAAAALLAASAAAPGRQQQGQQAQGARPALDEWGDDFDGAALDETKWELHTFEGGGGGKVEVKDKKLRMQGQGGSRAGVRSRKTFTADRFFAEAALVKVTERPPEPGQQGMQLGTAILTILFDGKESTRIEWLLRSDGVFEAWLSQDGRMERLDNGKLATKEKSPRLGIARRGEEIYFMLNGEVGLKRTARALPADFKVMLYGFGATENQWDSIRVQTLKQQ